MPSITEMLAAMRNTIREGGTVDTAKFAELTAQAAAESQAEELRAEGKRTREAEKIAREREARRAQAATEVRDTIGTAQAEVIDAYRDVLAKIEHLDAKVNAYNDTVKAANTTLRGAGYASWNRASFLPPPESHPDYDPALVPVIDEASPVVMDGHTHRPTRTGAYVHYAAAQVGCGPYFHEWKRNGNSDPRVYPPIPGLDPQ